MNLKIPNSLFSEMENLMRKARSYDTSFRMFLTDNEELPRVITLQTEYGLLTVVPEPDENYTEVTMVEKRVWKNE